MEQLRRSSKKCVFIAERDHLRIWNDHGPEERTEIIYLLLRSSIMMLCLSTRHNQSSAAQHFDRACMPLCHWQVAERQSIRVQIAFRHSGGSGRLQNQRSITDAFSFLF
jgi:hypothetical protein